MGSSWLDHATELALANGQRVLASGASSGVNSTLVMFSRGSRGTVTGRGTPSQCAGASIRWLCHAAYCGCGGLGTDDSADGVRRRFLVGDPGPAVAGRRAAPGSQPANVGDGGTPPRVRGKRRWTTWRLLSALLLRLESGSEKATTEQPCTALSPSAATAERRWRRAEPSVPPAVLPSMLHLRRPRRDLCRGVDPVLRQRSWFLPGWPLSPWRQRPSGTS